jgi:tRNA A-37 threonylcarbamoyl transferase component Bud32
MRGRPSQEAFAAQQKNGGYAADVKERLHREAVVLNALQNTGVLVPKYYAYNQELGWLLQEWVHGEVMISELQTLTFNTRCFANI